MVIAFISETYDALDINFEGYQNYIKIMCNISFVSIGEGHAVLEMPMVDLYVKVSVSSTPNHKTFKSLAP